MTEPMMAVDLADGPDQTALSLCWRTDIMNMPCSPGAIFLVKLQRADGSYFADVVEIVENGDSRRDGWWKDAKIVAWMPGPVCNESNIAFQAVIENG